MSVTALFSSTVSAQPVFDIINLFSEDNVSTIDYATLKANDYNSSNYPGCNLVSANDGYMPLFEYSLPVIYPTFDNTTQKVIISNLAPGYYIFYYRYDSNMCPITGSAAVVVQLLGKKPYNLSDCCPDDCNLICESDFQNYPATDNDIPNGRYIGFLSDYWSQIPFYYALAGHSSLSKVYAATNNQSTFLLLKNTIAENDSGDIFAGYAGYKFPLREAILPGETITLNFDASSWYYIQEKIGCDQYLRVFGLNEDIPANDNILHYPHRITSPSFPINNSGTIATNLLGNIDEKGVLIPAEDVFVPDPQDFCEDFIGFAGVDDFHNYSFTYTNQTASPITHILIESEAIFSENLTDQDPNTNCRNLCVGIDNFTLLKQQLETDSICIRPLDYLPTFCQKDTSFTLQWIACFCPDPLLPSGCEPVTIALCGPQYVNGKEITYPNGSFDSSGMTIITIPCGGPCPTLSLDVNFSQGDPAGIYSFELSGCSQGELCHCSAQSRILTLPIVVHVNDCEFPCACRGDLGTKIGSQNSTIYWSDVLPASIGTDTCIAVEGTLIIDEDIVINLVTFVMNPGSSILTETNQAHNVNIYNCYFIGCRELWKGIRLRHPNDTLTFKNNVISDAREAVTIMYNTQRATIVNSDFTNNYVGVNLLQDINNNNLNNLILSHNTFSSTSLLGDPDFHTLGHIGFVGVSAGPNRNHIIYKNTFRNLAYGVYFQNSSPVIRANEFYRLPDVPYYTGSGRAINQEAYLSNGYKLRADSNYIDNAVYGIYSTSGADINNNEMKNISNTGIRQVSWGERLQIHHNTITARTAGISAQFYGFIYGLSITNNTLTDAATGLYSGIDLSLTDEFLTLPGSNEITYNTISAGTNLNHGILIRNGKNMHVAINTIQATGLSSSIGIGLYNLSNSIIECNDVKLDLSGGQGMSLSMLDQSVLSCNELTGGLVGLQASGENMSADIKGNLLKDNQIGLYYTLTAIVPSSLTGAQIGKQLNYGNQWMGSHTLTARCDAPYKNMKLGLYETRYDYLPGFPEGFVAPVPPPFNPAWFTANGQPDFACGLCALNAPTYVITPAMKALAMDSISFPVYDAQLRAQGKRMVYNHILTHPDEQLDPDMQAFSQQYGSSVRGDIAEIRAQLPSVMHLSLSQQAQVDSIQSIIDSLTSFIIDAQSALSVPPTQAELDAYYTLTDPWDDDISTAREYIGDQTYIWMVERILRADSLKNVLLDIAWDDQVSENDHKLTQVQLGRASRVLDYLFEFEIDYLVEIATQCPEYGGPAVYIARSYLSKYLPGYEWDDTDCLGQDSLQTQPTIEIRHQTDTEVEVTFTLAPNPTMGQSKLTASDPDFEGYVQVFDTRGAMIRMAPFNGEYLFVVNGQSGVHYCRILDKNLKVISTKKLVVIQK